MRKIIGSKTSYFSKYGSCKKIEYVNMIQSYVNTAPFQIHEFVNSEVSEYKRLAGGVVFVDAIPKSGTGKILRKDLKEAYIKENQ